MTLIRLILEHFVPSIIIGFVGWKVTGAIACIPAALITGWIIDSDHLLDLWIHYRNKTKTSGLSSLLRTGSYFKHNEQIIVILHSWELVILWGGLWSYNGDYTIAIIGCISWSLHLLIDQLTYPLHPLTYFLTFRIWNRFEIRVLCPGIENTKEMQAIKNKD